MARIRAEAEAKERERIRVAEERRLKEEHEARLKAQVGFQDVSKIYASVGCHGGPVSDVGTFGVRARVWSVPRWEAGIGAVFPPSGCDRVAAEAYLCLMSKAGGLVLC